MKIARLITIGVTTLAVLGACDSSDCPLNNTVSQVCNVYRSDNGASLTLSDTLTVLLHDSVVLNRQTAASTLSLPMSYEGGSDTLVFRYTPQQALSDTLNTLTYATDTLIITKSNQPHFVSLDCPTMVFHTISGVSWTRRTPDETFRYAIDSVAIKNAEVTNNPQENLQIFYSVYE